MKIKEHNGNSGEVFIDCGYNYYSTHSVRLEAEYSNLDYADSYEVSSIEYTPIALLSEGNLVHVEGTSGKYDDTFGSLINLPFTFCYYGGIYNQIVISDNGVISFDASLSGKDNSYVIAGRLPNTGLPRLSIFSLYHDMQLVDDQFVNKDLIKIHVQGTAPYRQFIINYENIPQFSSSRKSTFQVVL